MNTEKEPIKATNQLLDTWATEPNGPIALYLTQKLLPLEGIGGVIFPPTYADIGYNIDTLSDGTRVATIDSVGSQANRMEPIFESESRNHEDWLVPQVKIVLRMEPCGECEVCLKAQDAIVKAEAAEREAKDVGTKDAQERANKLSKEAKKADKDTKKNCKKKIAIKCSLLDLPHRAADAVVQSSPDLKKLIEPAFKCLQEGDAGPLCELAPTSLVFGFWDSRGESGERRPRLVRSIIRAKNVEPLYAAAQFSSIFKKLDEEQQEELRKAVKGNDRKLSGVGLADAPVIFRKVNSDAAKHMHEFREGSPNLERRVLGGVIAREPIERKVTVNLVALRSLRGKNDQETMAIRRYILGLSLMAATSEMELFLREGCLLRYADDKDHWQQVPRRGSLTPLALDRSTIEQYVNQAAEPFRVIWTKNFQEGKWPENLEFIFDIKKSKELLGKKSDDEITAGGS